jgi:hypothetical protein
MKRNREHFPEDFMFQLTTEEMENWRYLHRPHPGKKAKKYQVEELREWRNKPEISSSVFHPKSSMSFFSNPPSFKGR